MTDNYTRFVDQKTVDECELAIALAKMIDCGLCPVEMDCNEHGERKSCFQLIYEWLQREA